MQGPDVYLYVFCSKKYITLIPHIALVSVLCCIITYIGIRREPASQKGKAHSILMKYVSNPINCYQLFIHFKAYASFKKNIYTVLLIIV